MLARILIFIFYFSCVAAHAELSCDRLLGLSEASRAYVNLVQHHMNQSGGVLSADITNKILNSDQFVNPFLGGIDTKSNQLSAGIETLRSKISADGWRKIQNDVQVLVGKTKIESLDRQEKEFATSYMFDPKEIVREPLYPEADKIKAIGLIDGRIIFSLAAEKQVEFFEFKSKSFEKLDAINYSSNIYSMTDWQVSDGRAYFTLYADKAIHLYEWIGNSAVEVQKIAVTNSAMRPTLARVGPNIFYTFVSSDGVIHLYELIDGKLVFKSELKVNDEFANTHAQWILKDGKTFISYVTATMGRQLTINLLEYANDTLFFLDKKTYSIDDRSMHAVHQLQDNFAVIRWAFNIRGPRILKIENSKIDDSSSAELYASIVLGSSGPEAWFTIRDNKALARLEPSVLGQQLVIREFKEANSEIVFSKTHNDRVWGLNTVESTDGSVFMFFRSEGCFHIYSIYTRVGKDE